jgi:hypothetical protein
MSKKDKKQNRDKKDKKTKHDKKHHGKSSEHKPCDCPFANSDGFD